MTRCEIDFALSADGNVGCTIIRHPFRRHTGFSYPLQLQTRVAKMTEPIINHDEAWDLSCYKRKDHNSARCYIKAIEWIARAGAVLPMIEREAGTDLAREVSWLLRNEPRLSAEKRGEVTVGAKHGE